jgi:hypothetical protein
LIKVVVCSDERIRGEGHLEKPPGTCIKKHDA